MGYYVAYDRINGNTFLGMSPDPIPLEGEGIFVQFFDESMPDLNKVTWSNGSCSFMDLPPTERIISKYQFLKRLTPEEYGTIKQAATVNAQVGYFWEMFENVNEIDLDLTDTVAALQMMEAGGILGVGRAVEILK
jgi:hypothetical protein